MIEDLKAGVITPAEAIKQFSMGDTARIGNTPLSNLYVQPLDCGFQSINSHLVFRKNGGDLVVLGAYPRHGKTAMMLQICQHVAETTGPVLVFSSEMSRESLLLRMLASKTGEAAERISTGQNYSDRVKRTHEALGHLPLEVNEMDASDLNAIVRISREANRRNKLSMIAIDHIQNIVGDTARGRATEVNGISRQLKLLARELKCPILALSQLNAKAEERGEAARRYNRTPSFIPKLFDLRESGGIAQDADAVIFLSRHELHIEGERVGEADVVIEKHRNGRTGRYVMTWDGPRTRVIDPRNKPQVAEIEGI